MRALGYHGGIQAITFLGSGLSLKTFVALWNFNIGSQWENVKCGISRKRLIVEQHGRKFGTRGSIVHIWKVLLMPDSFSLVWGHSVHFAKFPFLQFSSSSSNLYTMYHNHTGCHFSGDRPKIAKKKKNKKKWHFEIFLKQDHMLL